MLDNYKVNDFIDLLGSNAPAPGGGAAASLTAAIGIALSEMVLSLSIDNKKFADDIERLTRWKKQANDLAGQCLFGMDKDAEAYKIVNAAYKLPRESEEEKSYRKSEIQKSLVIGATPPIELMELALSCLKLTEQLIDNTTKMAVSDLGVAAVNLNGAIKGAWLNVLININSIEDEKVAGDFRLRGEKVLRKADALSDEIYEAVVRRL